MKEIKEFLEERLSDPELERMCQLTSNWTVNPFEYYPESKTVETSEEWTWSHAELCDDDVELLMRVCEMLSDAPPSVPIPVHVDVGPQKMTRRFTFQKGSKKLGLDVAKQFCLLLDDRPGYEVVIQQQGEKVIIEVSFWYRSELEYAQQAEDIKMLFEMAQHWNWTQLGAERT